MPDPNIAVVRDQDGRIHYASRDSKWVRDRLADGTLTDTEEVTDASSPADASTGDDQDTERPRGRSGNRQRGSGATDNGDNAGVPEPEAGS